jgi:protein AroM
MRIIPPLVASIVDGHQVGVIVPIEELMNNQAAKWHVLEKRLCMRWQTRSGTARPN